MRVGIHVGDIANEQRGSTTTRLAHAAGRRGHQVWYIGASDFTLSPAGEVHARGRRVARTDHRSLEAYLADLKGPTAHRERVSFSELDVLLLRSESAADAALEPWAASVGIRFGQLAAHRGVVVLNDPSALATALDRMYFHLFPEEVRPRTLVTRDREEVRAFARAQGTVVIKSVQGSGGVGSFLVRPEDIPNINQMFDAIGRDGYVIVQEYIEAAESGTLRLFLMNGAPLRHRGRFAAFLRPPGSGSGGAGARIAAAEVDDRALRIAELVRPKLVADGIFLAGLEIAGDKLLAVNVFDPGGLGSAYELEGVPFSGAVIDALERKVELARESHRIFDNVALATR